MNVELTTLMWCLAGVTIFMAGISQGALGFGFPAISTPVLAMMTDIKTAVILNMLPIDLSIIRDMDAPSSQPFSRREKGLLFIPLRRADHYPHFLRGNEGRALLPPGEGLG